MSITLPILLYCAFCSCLSCPKCLGRNQAAIIWPVRVHILRLFVFAENKLSTNRSAIPVPSPGTHLMRRTVRPSPRLKKETVIMGPLCYRLQTRTRDANGGWGGGVSRGSKILNTSKRSHFHRAAEETRSGRTLMKKKLTRSGFKSTGFLHHLVQ